MDRCSLWTACLTEDPELFFPAGAATGAALEQIERAKAVCRRRPVTTTR